jgi:hypothetical protein
MQEQADAPAEWVALIIPVKRRLSKRGALVKARLPMIENRMTSSNRQEDEECAGGCRSKIESNNAQGATLAVARYRQQDASGSLQGWRMVAAGDPPP